MLTGRDELRSLVETLSEAEAEAVLVHLRATMPQLYAGDDGYEPPSFPCEKCLADVPEIEIVDAGFTGPEGERHDRWLCPKCHAVVMDGDDRETIAPGDEHYYHPRTGESS